ncbi:large subunit ribosomal protein L19 [Hydrogenivirga caldilitoris]|uniref:Large ribosomal subunit protein bL19 n=1 Tax=Hydrogenivirga caldilitoris TaxID=246264 RepID=A0A497XR61_9AQUI|nr:50S ribosomal protein L19 [Hydrogenivirga caldilitoris]RLJ70670.1 large subunit ribosomal protein L19 [Hydrogenivirga caldilitoris]
MNSILEKVQKRYIQEKEYPDFKVGDTIKVYYRIKEGDRERIQPFEGVVIRIRGGGADKTFTVRKESYGVGIERIFPFYSPNIEKIEIVKIGRVRRAKLYFLRELKGKVAQRKIKEIKRWEYEAMQRKKEEARRQREEEAKAEEVQEQTTEEIKAEEAPQEE